MNPISAKTGMLIRKPVAEVFEAFVNPEIITKFWFTNSSGRLDAGKRVTWTWGMYDVSADINVLELEENSRVLFEWPNPVEWTFTPHGDNATFVEVTESGFSGDDAEIAEQAMASVGGFTIVLAGAKAYLEHTLQLNLVLDRFPHGYSAH